MAGHNLEIMNTITGSYAGVLFVPAILIQEFNEYRGGK